MEPIGAGKLAEMIPFGGDSSEKTPTVHSFLEEASALLHFEVGSDWERGSILIQQTGKGDWWNRLHPTVNLGYEMIGGIEIEPRVRRLSLVCKSMGSLRQALRDVRNLRMNSKRVVGSLKKEVEKVNTWELASAIIIVQTIRHKIPVCDKYVRWCKPEMRRSAGFKVDMPVCIKSGVGVSVERDSFDVRIDRGTKLTFYRVLLVREPYDGKQLLCGGEVKLNYSGNNLIDELTSEWGIHLEGTESMEPEDFYKSINCVYLH